MVKAAQAGIDTFKLASYLADDRSLRALRQPGLATRPAGGGALLVHNPEDGREWPVKGARTLFYPATSLLAVEGHPSGSRGVLAAPDDVHGWSDDLRELLHGHGITLADRLGVARCDAAVDLHFDTPGDGLAVLVGIAALQPPRLKRAVYTGDVIETVYYTTARGEKRGRWYDSGRAYETAEAGRIIRPEDQRRYDRPGRRLDVSTVTTENVRQAFQSRWLTLAKATKGVTVGSVPVIVDAAISRVEEGACSTSQAETAIGYALMRRRGAGYHSPATRTRRRRLLREMGLVLVEGELEPVSVDLGAVLDAALDRGAWGCG